MTTEADVFRAEHDAGEAVARWRDLERALVAVEARVDGRSGAGGEGERGRARDAAFIDSAIPR